jgi:hypothetical protein
MGGRAVSYTQIGVGIALLEHICVAVCFFSGSLVGLGLRIFFQSAGELGGYW